MPSVLQSPTTEVPVSGSFDAEFCLYSEADRHSVDSKAQSQSTKSIQSWYHGDDEFGVPIYTKQRLVPEKAPLDQSSFLLHYPTLQRSVEIMIPPGHSSTSQANPICPTMPDGPIYIHHRSSQPNTPLQRALRCKHFDCHDSQKLASRDTPPTTHPSSLSASLEYTFLQNQVGAISQWLASMKEHD